MAFNHYSKIKSIINQQPPGWYIRVINQPTTAKKFNGEVRKYGYYYRIYGHNDEPIKYCKFQQIERLAQILNTPVEALPRKNLDQ